MASCPTVPPRMLLHSTLNGLRQWNGMQSPHDMHRSAPELPNLTSSTPPSPLLPTGAVEVIGSLGVWKARRLLQMLAAWVERWGDPRVQGLFTTRTAGELLFGYE